MKVADPAPAEDSAAATRTAWRNRELIIAAACLSAGVLVLPALIYGVGTLLLGAYGGGPHLGSFFGDFFRNLAGGSVRTWFLILSPFLFVSLIRFVFRFKGRKVAVEASETAEPAESARARPTPTRRDPFISP